MSELQGVKSASILPQSPGDLMKPDSEEVSLKFPTHQVTNAGLHKEEQNPEKFSGTFLTSRDGIVPVEIAFSELKMWTMIGKPFKPKTRKMILRNISGLCKACSFTAIMGPSGSGKTTLLNFLSARLYSNTLKVNGKLRVNGREVSSINEFANIIAFVQQDDILPATSTVKEVLSFVARLRLAIPKKEREERVTQLIEELGLAAVQNTLIGNSLIRGISGGERKRVSIAAELLSNPSLIFLDEPTTGLDSSTALDVINLLRVLSRNGRTIITTIHQPSSEIFSNFDRLLLLSKGYIIYYGEAKLTESYFSKLGFSFPDYSNPADYIMKILNEDHIRMTKLQEKEDFDEKEVEKEFMKQLLAFTQSYEEQREVNPDLQATVNYQIPKENLKSAVGGLYQISYLAIRNWKKFLRNPIELVSQTVQVLFVSAMICIVFNDLGDPMTNTWTAYQNRNGAGFFITAMFVFNGFAGSQNVFQSDKMNYMREVSNRLYSPFSYFIAKNIVEVPIGVVQISTVVSIIYYAIGLSNDSAATFFCQLGNWLLAHASSVGFGLCISALVPSPEMANAMLPFLLMPMVLFSGFVVNLNNILVILFPFQYLSIFKYAFQISLETEFSKLQFPDGFDPLEIHNFREPRWFSFMMQSILAVISRSLAFFGVWYLTHHRPKTNSVFVEDLSQPKELSESPTKHESPTIKKA